jgi:pilus assembly protein CpaE
MTPILVEPDAPTAAELRGALGHACTVHTTMDAARAFAAEHEDQVVFVLGPNVDASSALRMAEAYRVTHPFRSVILLRRRLESSLLADAMRHGVREVVDVRDLAGLHDAVARGHALAQTLREGVPASGDNAPQRGSVVTVFSAKGGCGKTTLSTNIASMLAASGTSVCLVDLDLAFGDASIALQLQPEHTIADAAAMGGNLDADGLLGLLATHSSGLRVLAAPSTPASADSVKPEVITLLLELLAGEFDYVVVDTPPAFDDTTLAALDLTDRLIALTTLDVPAIKNLKLSIDTLHMIGFPDDRIRVVLNRADASVGISARDVEAAVKLPIVARVPASQDVPAATNRGHALTLDDPKHAVSRALADLVAAELPGPAAAFAPDARSEPSRRARRLPRLRRDSR